LCFGSWNGYEASLNLRFKGMETIWAKGSKGGFGRHDGHVKGHK
jgi:hypothetical protein